MYITLMLYPPFRFVDRSEFATIRRVLETLQLPFGQLFHLFVFIESGCFICVQFLRNKRSSSFVVASRVVVVVESSSSRYGCIGIYQSSNAFVRPEFPMYRMPINISMSLTTLPRELHDYQYSAKTWPEPAKVQ